MDADTLRLILIVAGGLLLVGLYLWERGRSRPGEDASHEGEVYEEENEELDEEPDENRQEPHLGDLSGEEGDERRGMKAAGSDIQGPLASSRQEAAPDIPESPLILSVHLIPLAGAFDGEDIVHAAGHCGLEPGEMDVFHHFSGSEARIYGSAEAALFSMANMVEPGTFPFGGMAEFQSPGLTLFTQVEGASNDLDRLEAMLNTACCLAEALDAEIRDENRLPFTPEIEERLRDQVQELVTRRLSNPDEE